MVIRYGRGDVLMLGIWMVLKGLNTQLHIFMYVIHPACYIIMYLGYEEVDSVKHCLFHLVQA